MSMSSKYYVFKLFSTPNSVYPLVDCGGPNMREYAEWLWYTKLVTMVAERHEKV